MPPRRSLSPNAQRRALVVILLALLFVVAVFLAQVFRDSPEDLVPAPPAVERPNGDGRGG